MNLGLLTYHAPNANWVKQVVETKYQVAWQAQDVTQTLTCQLATPVDLLLVKLHEGWSAQDIQQLTPYIDCPIILFSLDGNNHTQKVFAAFGYGAKDYVELSGAQQDSGALLLRKIKQQIVLQGIKPRPVETESSALPVIIAIGASTGGPSSLYELIQALPTDFNAVIVIVQHMDGRFSTGLADWLERGTSLQVKLIAHREKAEAGTIYIAGADIHLRISEEGRFIYSEEPEHSLFKPSIDVFFESLSKNWRGIAIGVLLTGMGQDGALGLKLMKNRGWVTIAQDQASSVVYGMPKAAVHLQAATEVLPLDRIAARLIKLCSD